MSVYLIYRLISQLPFVSKILERIVSKQLINHLNVNSLFDTRQSAYRKFHSPETLLLSILDNVFNKIANNSNIQRSNSVIFYIYLYLHYLII